METTRRSALADVAGYGYCRSHSRWFWGMRLHLVCAPDGTPRAASLVGADRPEREVALSLLPAPSAAARRSSPTRAMRAVIRGRRGRAGRHSSCARPVATSPSTRSASARIRQRIESVFQTFKDLLSLERHGARTLENLRARVGDAALGPGGLRLASTTNSGDRVARSLAYVA